MASEKLPVTFLQDKTGQIKAIRVNGATIPVLRVGPSPALGQMDWIITLANVEQSFEPLPETDPAPPSV